MSDVRKRKNNINTVDYYDFTVLDYKGDSTSLSSYNLNYTPITFIPIISSKVLGFSRVVWSTGDGEFIEAFSPQYVYKKPGLYTVTLMVYTDENDVVRSSVSKNILIKDYLEDTFNVKYSSLSSLQLTAGCLSDPLSVTQSLPIRLFNREVIVPPKQSDAQFFGFVPRSIQRRKVLKSIDQPSPPTIVLEPTQEELQQVSAIRYTLSGAKSTNFFFLPLNLYNHLEIYNSLFTKTYVDAISTYDITQIPRIQLPLTAVYVELSGTQLVETYEYTNNRELVGYKGEGLV